jgi:UDP-N-acetylmuramoyl-L-alanyl-D-glutamate--2,6-diaminopimelate ligase
MGLIVAELADLALVTSDNPRTEDPESIIDDILAGMGEAPCERIPDRREAIARALEVAEPDDVVILAGKGHERYQVVGSEQLPFDEREVVREYLTAGKGA